MEFLQPKRALPIWQLLLSVITTTTTLFSMVQAVPVQLHGLNYNTRQGPDWDWDKCKSRATVQTDLTLLKRLTNRVRLLSLTDCNQGSLVLGVAREFGMQLWLGLWVGPDDFVFEEEKRALQELIDQGMFADDTILGITVGSEAIYRNDATVNEMIRNLNEVYTILQNAKITDLPVTIVDIAPVYSRSSALRSAVNVTMTNTFPFWEAVPIDRAVADLQEDLDWLLNLPESQNKPFVLGETGWPSDGFIEGVGIAGPDQQRQYFEEAYCRMHVENRWSYYWFTGIDNAWRREQDPNNTIEEHWGFFYTDLRLKEHFQDFSFQCSDGVTYSFAEIDFTIPTGFTPAPAAVDPANCQAHSQCTGLFGNCCPNDLGVTLGCCDATVPSPPTANPVSSPVRPTVIPTATARTVAPVKSNVVMTSLPNESSTSFRPIIVSTARPVAASSPTSPSMFQDTLVSPSPEPSLMRTVEPTIGTLVAVSVFPVVETPTVLPTTSRPVLETAKNDKSFPPTRIPVVSESGSHSSFRPAFFITLLLLGTLTLF